ncbi:MAG: extracellular matrix regulator RemB [Chloroflexota bacterium]
MFVHLGADVVVRSKDIVCISDIRARDLSPITREFLEVAREEGFLRDIASGEPKAFAVTVSGVYLSPISSMTLRKRAEYPIDDAIEPQQQTRSRTNGGSQ